MKNMRINQNCCQKKTVLGGPKEHDARKASRKAMRVFGRVDFALAHQKRVQAMISTRTKAEARTKKERARKVLILNLDFQPLEHPVKKDMAIPGNQAIGISTLLMIPPVQLAEALLSRTIQDSWYGLHQFLWNLPTIRRTLFSILVAHGQLDRELQPEGARNMRCIMASRQNSVLAISLLCLPILRQTCRESCNIHFPTTPPCSTRVDVLETGAGPILFSLPQMNNLGPIIELNPKGDEITCPVFILYSSPVEYSTTGHIVLDLTSLAYQPKSPERSARPTKHLTFAPSKKSWHIQLLHNNWETTKVTNLLFAQVRLPFLKMKMISFW